MYLIHPVSLIEGTIPSLNNVSFTWVHACQGTSQVALVIKNLPAGAGDSEGQGRLVCCRPWGHRVRHNVATEQP